ncbi:oligosaccharide flippase family protein [Fluviibacter sp.]
MRTSSMINACGFVLTTLLQLLLYPVLINMLGKSVFGLYVYYVSISSLLCSFDLSVMSGMVHHIAANISDKNYKLSANIFKTSLAFYFVFVLVTVVFLFALLNYLLAFTSVMIENFDVNVMILVFLQSALILFATTILSALRCFGNFFEFNFGIVFCNILNYGVMIICIWFFKMSLAQSLICTNIVLIACVWLAFVCVKRFLSKYDICVRKGSYSFPALKMIVSYSYVLNFHSWVGSGFYTFQRVVLGYNFGPEGVASYQIVYSLVSKAHAFVNSVYETLFPWVSANAGSKNLSKVYSRSLAFSFLMAIIMMASVIIFGENIIAVWLRKPPSAEMIEALYPFSVAFLFVCLSVVPFHVANALGFGMYNFYYGLATALIYVCIYFALLGSDFSFYDLCLVYMFSNLISGTLFQLAVYRKMTKRALNNI